ncbi:MAG: VanZ family protein [Ruminococcaceae bacterium]|nr:VanZ family protein [Oscillospiraceae bacterium]
MANNIPQKVGRILFGCYVLLMLWLLFGQRIGFVFYDNYFDRLRESTNLIPFYTVSNYIRVLAGSEKISLVRHAIINLAGNIVMFIPLGFFVPWFFDKFRSFVRTFAFSAGVIFVVEIVQLFTLLGSADIDDLILNLIGVSLGYALFRLFSIKLILTGKKD